MNLSTQPYKGARDFYPEDKRLQKYMFNKLRQVVESFGYQEYDAPLLEPLDLYTAKSSDEIVSEQTYTFEDRGGRQVVIRPEMTPTVSRMVAGRRQELAYPLRLYSIPNLWRYERPQAGRLREHWQLNVDLFGVSGISADHEVVLVADAILKSFGAQSSSYKIRINSRQHMDAKHQELELSEAQKKTVMSIIDKKDKVDTDKYEALLKEKVGEQKAVKLLKYLKDSEDMPSNIQQLMKLLTESGVDNVVYDRTLVRGFDYYTDIVFEVFDTHPDNNRSMFGGGRYDGLVGQFGVEPLPTVGFGMGDVTLQKFLETHKLLPKLKAETELTVILVGDVYDRVQPVLNKLRQTNVNVAVDSTNRKLDAQIKNAVKSGVRYALFLGEKELESNTFKLRDLEKGEEKQLSLDQIASSLAVGRE
ncbi:histidine--tRNA ligase [Candidatus Saccharibacteria bacterium]|nr:histidine--tRNA ligase [Candidatus Saccharibacteria bacterium]